MSNVETSVPGCQESLQVSYATKYRFIWSDQGLGSSADCTVYRPEVVNGYFIVGDYAQEGSYTKAATGAALVVKPINDDSNRPLLKPPTGWVEVWNDRGGHKGKMNGSIWAPVPPTGYYALGHVATAGYDAPSIPEFRCVRADLLEPTQVDGTIWADKGSGATKDCVLFSIHLVPNTFVSQLGKEDKYHGSIFRLKEQV